MRLNIKIFNSPDILSNDNHLYGYESLLDHLDPQKHAIDTTGLDMYRKCNFQCCINIEFTSIYCPAFTRPSPNKFTMNGDLL